MGTHFLLLARNTLKHVYGCSRQLPLIAVVCDAGNGRTASVPLRKREVGAEIE